MNKIYILMLVGLSTIGMQRDLPISYSSHARDKMKELKVTEELVNYIVLNGDRYEDEANPNSIIFAQRSPLPGDHSNDQLIVVVSREPKNNSNHIVTVYYNEEGLKTKSKKPTDKPHWRAPKTTTKNERKKRR